MMQKSPTAACTCNRCSKKGRHAAVAATQALYGLQEMAKSRPMNMKGQKGFKMLVLNETDRLSAAAQHSLRRTMEKYSASCRLILCCNNVSKVSLSPMSHKGRDSQECCGYLTLLVVYPSADNNHRGSCSWHTKLCLLFAQVCTRGSFALLYRH